MNTKISLIALILVGISTQWVLAQNTPTAHAKTNIAVEIDPATFAFNGYSAHLRIQPKSSMHMLYGLGIYAMDMPSPFVNMNSNNADKDWDVRINRGIGIFGEYHFGEVNKKFFVGTQLSMQEFQIKKVSYAGKENFTNALLMASGGYTLQPFNFPLYIKAWGGVGYTTKMAGKNILDEQTYDIAPITVFATVHVGYTF